MGVRFRIVPNAIGSLSEITEEFRLRIENFPFLPVNSLKMDAQIQIAKNSKFSSFEEFETTLKQYEEENNVLFVKVSSKKVSFYYSWRLKLM